MPYEREHFQKFLAGEPDDRSWKDDWLSNVRAAIEAGRRFARVRVVDVPLTDYSRWIYEGAKENNAAGEDIRYLRREQALDVGLPNHDYWLFDSNRLLRMNFDDEDHHLYSEFIDDPAEIVQHNHWRDVAWHHAVRRDDFAIEEQVGRT